jgi:hypothetical protein
LQKFQAKREIFANILQNFFAKLYIYRFVQLQSFCKNFAKFMQNCKNLNKNAYIFTIDSAAAFANFAKFFANPRIDKHTFLQKFCKFFSS